MRILGVDPGSRLTGWGCIDVLSQGGSAKFRLVAHGTLSVGKLAGAAAPLDQRLLLIQRGLSEVIEKYHPAVMSIEKVFFAKNAVSALKLGQARGAAILTGAMHSLELAEYSATEVKAALSGHGQAQKEQVAKMIELLFGKQTFDSADASDAVAVAVCHGFRCGFQLGEKKSAWLEATRRQGKRKRLSLAESVGLK